ncbi:hypothetical protein L195_g038126 [Trifolium pratense]|uniref:Uncharacterized protein n=1 Tax=Trifolium pratense TaxID=57577 RepID=A0A2K3LUB2_TRIPR|nr:hypothetical protein L195_g038126 [Trifolium pratense]
MRSYLIRRDDRASVCFVDALGETEGGCVSAGTPTLNPQCWAKAFDDINGHQVAAGKRLENHDEQLMLIIPVNDIYNASDIETVGA